MVNRVSSDFGRVFSLIHNHFGFALGPITQQVQFLIQILLGFYWKLRCPALQFDNELMAK